MMKFTCFGLLLLLLGSCVEFKQLSLYDGVEPAPVVTRPESINQVVEPEIYTNDPADMWGLEETVCKKAEITYDETYEGDQAVQVTWDRGIEGCEFAGIGIGWDNYAGKDLTPVMDYAAITFYVKAQEERMFTLPIVLTLEDYEGGMGFAYTANKYFERTFIDTSWQKVEVPLADFEVETESLNPSNIKQLQFELQQSGSIVIDNIQLEFFTPKEVEPWMEEEDRPDPLDMPVTLFDEGFINGNGWGLVENECRTVEITDAVASGGNKSLHARWMDECGISQIGVSWNKWFPVDFRGKEDNYALSFQVKNESETTKALNFYAGIEDYDRQLTEVRVDADFSEKGIFDSGWTKVVIPLNKMEGQIDFTNVKQVLFRMEKTGNIYLDEIRLVVLPID